MTTYTKPYLQIADQITLLKSRGMVIDDVAKAESYLSRLGYYRLSAYWHPFRERSTTTDQNGNETTIVLDTYKSGTRFDTIVDFYVFDKKLRLLFLDLLERIEVSLRTEISLQMGRYGQWAHRAPAMLSRKFAVLPAPPLNGTKHQEWLRKLDERAATSKEQYAVHFRNKYTSSPLPIWVAFELVEFGPLSHFLSGMRTADQWSLAHKYSIPRPELLSRWVRTFCDVRNICAHHARLWNKPIVNEPLPPKPSEIPHLEHLIGNRTGLARLYGAAAVGKYMLDTINPKSKWGERFHALTEAFPVNPYVSRDGMGLPPSWDSLPLWQPPS